MAVVFLLVFPVGIPTLFTYVLARNRHKLPPDWWPHNLQEEEGKAFNAHRAQKGNEWAVREEWRQQVWRPTVARWHKYEQRFGFLFNAYHHRFYWFESVMSIYKLLMTTVVVFVSGANASRGDILRMLYSMFMAVCLIALVAFLQPFKDADVLSVETMVQLELLLVLFAALFLSELPWAAGHPFSGLILVVLLLMPVFAVALLMWRSVRDELKKRGRHDSLQGGESSRPRATTKVTAKFSPAARSSERKKPGLERLDTSFNMVNPLASQRMDNDPGGGEKGSGSGRERPAGMFRGASRWAKKPRLPGKGKRGGSSRRGDGVVGGADQTPQRPQPPAGGSTAPSSAGRSAGRAGSAWHAVFGGRLSLSSSTGSRRQTRALSRVPSSTRSAEPPVQQAGQQGGTEALGSSTSSAANYELNLLADHVVALADEADEAGDTLAPLAAPGLSTCSHRERSAAGGVSQQAAPSRATASFYGGRTGRVGSGRLARGNESQLSLTSNSSRHSTRAGSSHLSVTSSGSGHSSRPSSRHGSRSQALL
jgi:hypothetical protein